MRSLEYPFLTEIAVHHFDSFRYLFDRQPASLFTNSYNPPGSSYGQGAAVEALIEFQGDLLVQYAGTMIANRYEYSLWVEGDEGDIWTDRKRVWWRPKRRRFFRPTKLCRCPRAMLSLPQRGHCVAAQCIARQLLQGKLPETSGEDNLWTLAMVEASIRSDHDGRKVRIDEVLAPR